MESCCKGSSLMSYCKLTEKLLTMLSKAITAGDQVPSLLIATGKLRLGFFRGKQQKTQKLSFWEGKTGEKKRCLQMFLKSSFMAKRCGEIRWEVNGLVLCSCSSQNKTGFFLDQERPFECTTHQQYLHRDQQSQGRHPLFYSSHLQLPQSFPSTIQAFLFEDVIAFHTGFLK